VLSSLNPVH